MRWTPKPPKRRYIGDKKIVTRFAFFPIEIDGEWIWLERYKVVKTWSENAHFTYGSMGSYGHDGWKEERIKL